MLQVSIPEREYFDEKKGVFIYTKPITLQLEHSLVSIAKWESKWKKPFLKRDVLKTPEESLDYIRCMTITQNVDPNVYYSIPPNTYSLIEEYINDEKTATWFREDENRRPNREIITSEIIYYWMISQGIPMECQKWHLSRLLTLIRVCNEKNKEASNPKGKRKSRKELFAQNRSLNAERRAKLNSKG